MKERKEIAEPVQAHGTDQVPAAQPDTAHGEGLKEKWSAHELTGRGQTKKDPRKNREERWGGAYTPRRLQRVCVRTGGERAVHCKREQERCGWRHHALRSAKQEKGGKRESAKRKGDKQQ